MARIRVAVVGVGNCASSLVQGVEFYRRSSNRSAIPGLMHLELGGYHIGDIEFVAAFDIAAREYFEAVSVITGKKRGLRND